MLDSYRRNVFTGVCANDISRSGSIGEDSGQLLHGIMDDVFKGENTTGYTFYDTAKDYIEKHPLNYQDFYTAKLIYSLALADQFMDFYCKQAMNKAMEQVQNTIDDFKTHSLYQEISMHLHSENLLEELNFKIKQRLLFVYPLHVMLQVFNDSLIDYLIEEDEENSKRIFQLILDEHIDLF